MPNSIQAPRLQVRFHFLFALVGAAAFTFESWAFGPYSWMYGYGSGLETIPAHLALSFDDRNFSFWAPFVAGGVDRLSFWGNADPFNIEPLLIALFPAWLANGVHRFLQYFIAIYFTTRVAREQLHLSWPGAYLAGYLHGCLAYFTFGEMLAFPGVPLLVWLLDWLRRSPKAWHAVAAGAAFSVCTSFTHSDPYLLVFALGWIALVWRDLSRKTLGHTALFFGALFAIDSPQLLAALANAAFSHRSEMLPETINMSLDGLFYRQFQFDFFNQDRITKTITMNLPALAIISGSAFALFRLRDQRDRSRATALLAVSALYALLSQRWLLVGGQNIIGEFLPWVRGIYMGRFFTLPATFLASCALALISILMLENLKGWKHTRRVLVATVIGFCAFMTLWPKIALFRPVGIDGWGQFNFEVASLEGLKTTPHAPFRVASVLPLQPSYAAAQGFETVDGWVNLYPGVYRDFWLRILHPLFREVPKSKQIFDPDEGRPQDNYIFLGADLVNSEVGRLPGEDMQESMRTGFDIDRRFNLRMLGLLNVRFLFSELPLRSQYIRLHHEPLQTPAWPISRDWATGKLSGMNPSQSDRRARSPLSSAVTDYLDSVAEKRKGKDLYVYELMTWIPRFRFIRELIVTNNGKETLDYLEQADKATLTRSVVIERSGLGPLASAASPVEGVVRVSQETPNDMEIAVDSPATGVLVIGISWSPYWRASVDGKRRPLVRANHIQMALQILPGEKNVRLQYVPLFGMRTNKSN